LTPCHSFELGVDAIDFWVFAVHKTEHVIEGAVFEHQNDEVIDLGSERERRSQTDESDGGENGAKAEHFDKKIKK